MARQYTKKNGIQVTLTDDHLDTAIEIYQELSKLSPSGRVSWARLSSMMHDCGYYDAENTENYRSVIKAERKSRGVLPTANELASMVSESKIQAIRNEIGHMKHVKQEMQDNATRLNRLKRELSRDLWLSEYIGEKISELDLDFLQSDIKIDYNSNNDDCVCLLTLNDIHYGWLSDKDANSKEYYWDILESYLTQVIEFGVANNVSEFIVANLGDEIEGRLRNQSLIDARELAVEQIINVTELILKFLTTLRCYGFNVKYLSLFGNHSRIDPNKHSAMENDDYGYIHKVMIKNLLKDTNIEYIDTLNNYDTIYNVYGNNVFMSHGHRHSIQSEGLLSKLSDYYDTPLDIVMFGHLHSHYVKEVGYNKYHIITGALKDPDDFSDKIKKKSSKSQVGILFYSDGNFDIRQIKIND